MMKVLTLTLGTLLLTACGSGGTSPIIQPDAADAAAEVPAADARDLPDLGAEAGAEVPDLPRPDVLPDLDASDAELPPACLPGEGCFLDPCTQNADCQSAWCVEHMGDGVCTLLCQEECPQGWNCKLVGSTGPDPVSACVSAFANLCKPCVASAECKSPGGAEDLCLDYGQEGSFCGGPCEASVECPWGFSCKPSQTVEGIETLQCVADAGACPCAARSVELSLFTACETVSDLGVCPGKRVCTAEGLTPCDAPVPAAEQCNGIDDDCNGDTDEGTCDDGNPCTQDACAAAAGCEHVPLDNGVCSDDDPCTVAEMCQQGVCAGDPVICEDSNPCTDDVCTVAGGCDHLPNSVPCDDEDPCTVADQCSQKSCQGVPVSCDCLKDKDCAPLEDGNLCNGTLVCDTAKLPHVCVVDPETVLACPEPTGAAAVCLAPVCDPASGACSFAPAHEGFPCQNDNVCTAGDKCLAGTCADGQEIACGDGNPCTDDACLADQGCIHEANTVACSDGNVCTTLDLCIQAKCVGGPALDCNDANPCTDDACLPDQGCTHNPNSLPCDDGNACTAGDTCANGNCVAPDAVECDDANPCTADQCDALLGCFHNPLDAACSDGNPCTLNDSCKAGKCIPGPSINCDDANPCTDDACGPTGQCKHTPNQAACDDGNACTTGDHCSAGSCVPAAALPCDDKDICTDDLCTPGIGCTHPYNVNPCDDGSVCTSGDVCKDGECTAGAPVSCDDANPCTNDACDPAAGCTHAPNDAACDDGNACTTGDKCVAGICTADTPADCDDDNVCTTDSCLPKSGCLHKMSTFPCDDGNACTTGDKCDLGSCKPGKPLQCSDANPCTDDACDPAAGCAFTPNAAACDDANVCTTGDACVSGLCKPGAAIPCDDGNLCTTDSCDPQAGCLHPANNNPCSDANPCTTGDTCSGGACVPAGTLVCNDGNVCTDDSCDVAIGCKYLPNAVPCDDGNACTTGDKCGGGACTPAGTLTCNDGNGCTTDSCNPATGCVYVPVVPCCGNGQLEAGEECDDGNLTPGDGCNASCKKEVAVYVGSFIVHNGPNWTSNPPCYTCREACALLFGGNSSQYQCSTVQGSINNKAWLDGWGDINTYCGSNPAADDWKKSVNYNCGNYYCSYSAYVQDHGCTKPNYCWKK